MAVLLRDAIAGDQQPQVTKLNHDLFESLEQFKNIVCEDRYDEAIRRLQRSDQHMESACEELAEALVAISIGKTALEKKLLDKRQYRCNRELLVRPASEHEIKETHRAAKESVKMTKKCIRDALVWRCSGIPLGLDSRAALERAFEKACKHTNCDENTISQLKHAYRRIKEDLLSLHARNAARTAAEPEGFVIVEFGTAAEPEGFVIVEMDDVWHLI